MTAAKHSAPIFAIDFRV